ncbi:MAG: hypothetical protein AAF664_10140 [Planctomycetota bacterium]
MKLVRSSIRRSRVGFIQTFALFLTLASGLFQISSVEAAEPERTIWRGLSDSTLVGLRCENLGLIRQRMVDETKLGTVLFNDQRSESLMQWIEELGSEGLASTGSLDDFGLTVDDLAQVLLGSWGLAMVQVDEPEFSVDAYFIGWLSSETELVEKLWLAIGQAVDGMEDGEILDSVTSESIDGADVLSMRVIDNDFIKVTGREGNVALIAKTERHLIYIQSSETVNAGQTAEVSEYLVDELSQLLVRVESSDTDFVASLGAGPEFEPEEQRDEDLILEIVGDTSRVIGWTRQKIVEEESETF